MPSRVPKVVVIKKNGAQGSAFPMKTGRCSIGCNPDFDIYIRNKPTEDPVHCLVVVDEHEQAHLVNVNGIPGLVLNNRPVVNEAFLAHGDLFDVHKTRFRFEWCLKHTKKHTVTSNDAVPKGTTTPDHVRVCSGDESSFKTPQISPEMFVSPLTAPSQSDTMKNLTKGALNHLRAYGTRGSFSASKLSWSAGGTSSAEQHKEGAPDCASSRATPRNSRDIHVDRNPGQLPPDEAHSSEQHGPSASSPLKLSIGLLSWSSELDETSVEMPKDSSARRRSRNLPSSCLSSTTSRRRSSPEFGGEGSYLASNLSAAKHSSPYAFRSSSEKKAFRPSTSNVKDKSVSPSLREAHTKQDSSSQSLKSSQAGNPENTSIDQGSHEQSVRRSLKHYASSNPKSVSIDQDTFDDTTRKSWTNSSGLASRQSTSKTGKVSRSPSRKNVGADRGTPGCHPRSSPDPLPRSGSKKHKVLTNVSSDRSSLKRSLKISLPASQAVASRLSRSSQKEGKSSLQANSSGAAPQQSTSKRGEGSPSPSQKNVGTDSGTPRSRSKKRNLLLSLGLIDVSSECCSLERSLWKSLPASQGVASRLSRSSHMKGESFLHANSSGVAPRQSTPKTGESSPLPSQKNVGTESGTPGHHLRRSQAGNPEPSPRSASLPKKRRISLSPGQTNVSGDHGTLHSTPRKSPLASQGVASRLSRSSHKEGESSLQANSAVVVPRQSTSKTGEGSPSPSRRNVGTDSGTPRRHPRRSQVGNPEPSPRSASLPKKRRVSLSLGQTNVSGDHGTLQSTPRKLLHSSRGVASRLSRSSHKEGESSLQANSSGVAPRQGKSKTGEGSPSPSRKNVGTDSGTPGRHLKRSQVGNPEFSPQSRSSSKKCKVPLSPEQTNVSFDFGFPDRSQRESLPPSPSGPSQSRDTDKKGGSSSPYRKDKIAVQRSPERSPKASQNSSRGGTLRRSTSMTKMRKGSSLQSIKNVTIDQGSPKGAAKDLEASTSTKKDKDAPSPDRKDIGIDQPSVATSRACRGRPLLKRAAVQKESVSRSCSDPKAAKVTENSPVRRTKLTRATKKAVEKNPGKQSKQAGPSRGGRQGQAIVEVSGINKTTPVHRARATRKTSKALKQSPKKGPRAAHSPDNSGRQAVVEEDAMTEGASPAHGAKTTRKVKKAPQQSPTKNLGDAQSRDGSPSEPVAGATSTASGFVATRGRRKAATAALDAITAAAWRCGKCPAEKGEGTPVRRTKNSTAMKTKQTPVKKKRGKKV